MVKPKTTKHTVTWTHPGAAIGWRKDRSVFGEVVGISLLSPAPSG